MRTRLTHAWRLAVAAVRAGVLCAMSALALRLVAAADRFSGRAAVSVRVAAPVVLAALELSAEWRDRALLAEQRLVEATTEPSREEQLAELPAAVAMLAAHARAQATSRIERSTSRNGY